MVYFYFIFISFFSKARYVDQKAYSSLLCLMPCNECPACLYQFTAHCRILLFFKIIKGKKEKWQQLSMLTCTLFSPSSSSLHNYFHSSSQSILEKNGSFEIHVYQRVLNLQDAPDERRECLVLNKAALMKLNYSNCSLLLSHVFLILSLLLCIYYCIISY